jgi:hypothetical protein
MDRDLRFYAVARAAELQASGVSTVIVDAFESAPMVGAVAGFRRAR